MTTTDQIRDADWRDVRFRYLADVHKGRLPSSSFRDSDCDRAPYLSMEYLRGVETDSPTLLPVEPDLILASDGDILLLWDGSNAGEFLRARRGIVSSTTALVRPRSVDPAFFYWACKASEVRLRAETVGMGIPHVDRDVLANLRLPLPTVRQQRRIAGYLDHATARIDALIAEKQRILDLLEERRRSIATHAVTRGLNPAAPLRDSGVPWLPNIPADWDTRRIAWLFRERDERGAPNLPLLEVSIKSGVSVREFSDDRIEATASDFNTYKIARPGDVVFNKMRMWQGAVGVAPEDGLVSPDYVVARPTGGLLPQYANLLFRTGRFSAECARRSHGIVWDRLRLYWAGFRSIVVPLPSLDVQKAITDHVCAATMTINALVAATDDAIALLRERRATLISAVVTGRVNMEDAT